MSMFIEREDLFTLHLMKVADFADTVVSYSVY